VNYSWPNKYGNMSLNPRYTGSLYWCWNSSQQGPIPAPLTFKNSKPYLYCN